MYLLFIIKKNDCTSSREVTRQLIDPLLGAHGYNQIPNEYLVQAKVFPFCCDLRMVPMNLFTIIIIYYLHTN